MARRILGLDIGSNSIGSAWIDADTGAITVGTSVFPAGVEESDDKRGEPKNAKRRMTRRTRITLRRRAERKRALIRGLIQAKLLPSGPDEFRQLLEETDPWDLRRRGLDEALTPYQFGRALLHMAQRRGALGLKVADADAADDSDDGDDGKVKRAIGEVRAKMLARKARTFGEFMMMVRAERVIAVQSANRRSPAAQRGKREFRGAIRNKSQSYEHCADRAMIRDEFSMLWEAQRRLGGATAKLLSDELRAQLDDKSGDEVWRERGLLFGQRRQSWDLGTLGRCVLEPTERCVPHADMYASQYLVVETVNNLKIIERGREARPLTPEERNRIKEYLSGPLGEYTPPKRRGSVDSPQPRPKTTASVTDLRKLMGWGRATKTSEFRFNIESDEDRLINTDWFSREIVHGALTPESWARLPERAREGINRAILKFDPEQEGHAQRLKAGVMDWAKLDECRAEALLAAWRRRPRIDAKRLNMSRRAVRNLLAVMDRDAPWPDANRPGAVRWLTQIEARKLIAEDGEFCDSTTGRPLDDRARERYASGAKGLSARDRYYLRKHQNELPPAPLISNPVVRKAIHEVRRHVQDYLRTLGCKPEQITVELAREARMGAKAADRLLFRNRLRNRIRRDIIDAFGLDAGSSTQQRASVDRVILCVQQGSVCPLCGQGGITPRMAADGEGCEISHIVPSASGGHNGFTNIVLGHTKCNRDMGRRTPTQLWSDQEQVEAGKRWVEGIYGDIKRSKPSEMRGASGESLWQCYFTKRDDLAKLEQFQKNVRDIQEMTQRQEAATKYATRQVMTYLADALYEGKGLPERGGERVIFATDGMWTSRLRLEWGLFFDPHEMKSKGLSGSEEHQRKEKNRGDHRHHAIDAIVIALGSQSVQRQWEARERQADLAGVNTADEVAMDRYRRDNPIPLPLCYKSRDELREAVRRAVFGDPGPGDADKPVCHRPVKRKLIGALHEETLFGPVLDRSGSLTENFTARKSILSLKPKYLRMPRQESTKEAVDRLTARRLREKGVDAKAARAWARATVSSPGYAPAMVDPPLEKGGIVRDVALRARIRKCIEMGGLDPDSFTPQQIKKLFEAGGFTQASGVPIRSAVLLRTMLDPVIISRWATEHATGRRYRVYDAESEAGDAAAARAYLGGNQHHIEIRVDSKGRWTGTLVSAFEAAQRKLAKLRALRKAGIPPPKQFRELPKSERRRMRPQLASIERAHPLVDRSDNDALGGAFVMSLCEGEMLLMKHKQSGELGYFVVAKLDKPQSVVVVPHWDARAATDRKDSEGKRVADSSRAQLSITPNDLRTMAPPGHEHTRKLRVSPLGVVHYLDRD